MGSFYNLMLGNVVVYNIILLIYSSIISKDYKNKLEEIRERMTKRMNR